MEKALSFLSQNSHDRMKAALQKIVALSKQKETSLCAKADCLTGKKKPNLAEKQPAAQPSEAASSFKPRISSNTTTSSEAETKMEADIDGFRAKKDEIFGNLLVGLKESPELVRV